MIFLCPGMLSANIYFTYLPSTNHFKKILFFSPRLSLATLSPCSNHICYSISSLNATLSWSLFWSSFPKESAYSLKLLSNSSLPQLHSHTCSCQVHASPRWHYQLREYKTTIPRLTFYTFPPSSIRQARKKCVEWIYMKSPFRQAHLDSKTALLKSQAFEKKIK